jgi:hypothetical protein
LRRLRNLYGRFGEIGGWKTEDSSREFGTTVKVAVRDSEIKTTAFQSPGQCGRGVNAAVTRRKQMTGRPGITRLLAAAVLMCGFAGCRLPATAPLPSPVLAGPVDVRAAYAAGTLVPLNPNSVSDQKAQQTAVCEPVSPAKDIARAAPPSALLPVPELTGKEKAAQLNASTPEEEPQWVAASSLSAISKLPRLRAPIVIREESDTPQLPQSPSVQPGEPPMAAASSGDAPLAPAGLEPSALKLVPTARTRDLPPAPDVPPAKLPPLPDTTATLPASPADQTAPTPVPTGPVGPIMVGDQIVTFDSLSKLVDGQGCSAGSAGCSTCGDCPPGRPCAAGGRKCEPFPESRNPLTRFVGLLYENICCPDPCYQPKWEPLADAAFFVDAARPNNNMRFRWDYGDHLTYPDRGEYFFARGDGNGKGPTSTNPALKGIPYVDYHQLGLVTEMGAGPASVAISVPYETVNATPFGKDAAGFSDMTVTMKTLLVDSQLFMVASQFRTYIPTGNFGKGLGTGHVSLEPSLIFGLRLASETYVQGQVLEWIPIAGDPDYASAYLRWGVSLNQLLWKPVKDVQLIGTLELDGTSFQDGLYTDPVLGPQKLSGQNALSVANGYRIFFCNTFDVGVAGSFGITGKYLVRDEMRFEMRFRY